MPRSRHLSPFLLLASSLGAACAAPPAPPPAPAAPAPPQTAPPPPAAGLQCRADQDRLRALAFEVERLRADLRAAEETLLAVESGMRGATGRAEAVSALAEARIEVERAARRAPWRGDAASEARDKLAEAERQLSAQRVGSAVFFVSRARRIAESLELEAAGVAAHANTRFVRPARVNLRSGPSAAAEVLETLPARLPVFVEGREGEWSLVRTTTGRVGFVHSDLLGPAR
jgi:hypothetical protein